MLFSVLPLCSRLTREYVENKLMLDSISKEGVDRIRRQDVSEVIFIFDTEMQLKGDFPSLM